MRVTGMMQNTQLLRNLRNTNAGIVNWQNQLATGQRIQRPGDDPVGIGYQMRYDTELARGKEFLENTRTGLGWLSSMDSNLQQATEVLQRARVLVQQGLTGTVPEDARRQIAAEIKQLREQMVAIGNSTYDGRHMFNGQKTDAQPYTVAGANNESTDTGMYYLNVSSSVIVPVSITGEQIFGGAGDPDNVFLALDEIYTNLMNNDMTALGNGLGAIDVAADRISVNLAEVGARMNRFELIENRLLDEQNGLKQLRGQVADVDMADAIIQLQIRENILQASLATGSRIMQVSLIDYIR